MVQDWGKATGMATARETVMEMGMARVMKKPHCWRCQQLPEQ